VRSAAGSGRKGSRMRATYWLIGLAGLVAAGCNAVNRGEQERIALLDRDRAWSQTTNNVDQWLTYFAPVGTLYPQGQPIATGSGAIRETMARMVSVPGFMLRWSPDKVDISSSGDLGYTSGSYEMSLNDAAGNPTTQRGKYVTVWKKQKGGQWRVVQDIFNADGPSSS